MKLQNKVVLVTGGGTGVGRSVAELFAKEGAKVVITGRRESLLAEVSASIAAEPAVRYYAADVADRGQVQALIQWVGSEVGTIDILVSNAGLNVPERQLSVLSAESWELLMNVNATGAFYMVEAVLPAMRAQKDGVIISVSSIAGIRPSVLAGAAYNASKHAMTALTKSISLEERENGIRATCIHPGEINTPILDARPVPVSDERKAQILQPEDVADAVLFVATMHPRAHILEMTMKPSVDAFV
ncbi:MAG: SDR family oxidoreductase [Chloroflexota bacterium]